GGHACRVSRRSTSESRRFSANERVGLRLVSRKSATDLSLVSLLLSFEAVAVLTSRKPPLERARIEKKGASREAPFEHRLVRQRRSRDLSAGSTLNFACVEAPRTDANLRGLAVHEDARDLEVRLPDAAHLVVGVRDVVAERNPAAAHVASSLRHDQPSMSSMRAMSAPSPLRCPVLRIRV